jgi:SAM-dependent methyltransferase
MNVSPGPVPTGSGDGEATGPDDRVLPYYRGDLALVHHRGFAFHAEACAPGILGLLDPIRQRSGRVVEIGCGSGLLTAELVGAGHRVVATDASPAMIALARGVAPGVEELRLLTLPEDPIPEADAIVGVGHALNYLPDADAVDRALRSVARALLPGGVLAIDLCDLEWGRARRGVENMGRVGDDWAIITRHSLPSEDQFVREMTTFIRNPDRTWRRDDERHDNVLVDTARVPELLASEGIESEIRPSFGNEQFPVGLTAVIGRRPA